MLDINKIIMESLESISEEPESSDQPDANNSENKEITESKLAGADKDEDPNLLKNMHDQAMDKKELNLVDKAKKAVEDNPKTSAAVAAALAAGAGAVGLRKLLKKKNGK